MSRGKGRLTIGPREPVAKPGLTPGERARTQKLLEHEERRRVLRDAGAFPTLTPNAKRARRRAGKAARAARRHNR